MRIVAIARSPCKLIDCPPGLFIYNGEVGFKTADYSNLPDRIEVYLLSTGEKFTGGEEYTWATAELEVRPAVVVEQ